MNITKTVKKLIALNKTGGGRDSQCFTLLMKHLKDILLNPCADDLAEAKSFLRLEMDKEQILARIAKIL